MRSARSKCGVMWASRPTRCDRIRRRQARIGDGSARDVEDAVPYDEKGNAAISADPVGRDAHIAPRSTHCFSCRFRANPHCLTPCHPERSEAESKNLGSAAKENGIVNPTSGSLRGGILSERSERGQRIAKGGRFRFLPPLGFPAGAGASRLFYQSATLALAIIIL